MCQVCGAFLVTNDSSDRLEAHYQGKQHQGYLKIRETLDQIKVTIIIMVDIKVQDCITHMLLFSNQNNLEAVTETTRVHVMIIAMIAVTEVGIEITVVILIGIVATENEMTMLVAAVTDELVGMMTGTEKWNDTTDAHVITMMIIHADHVHDHQEEAVTINATGSFIHLRIR